MTANPISKAFPSNILKYFSNPINKHNKESYPLDSITFLLSLYSKVIVTPPITTEGASGSIGEVYEDTKFTAFSVVSKSTNPNPLGFPLSCNADIHDNK